MEQDNRIKRLAMFGIIMLMLTICGIILFNYFNYKNASSDVVVEVSEYKPTKSVEVLEEESETPTPTPTPTVSEEKLISDTILTYQEQYNNPEIIGRIYIPGTIIDYPIAQRKEDIENYYYLKHNYYGNPDEDGSIYLDFENDFNNDDKNTIIYGHNMSGNRMFHSLRYFQNEEYFKKRKYIFVETLTETKVYKNISWMKTHIDFEYLTVNFNDDSQYKDLQQGIIERNIYSLEEELTTDDYILNLSTCDNDTSNDDYRFVLTGVLVNTYPIGADIPELKEISFVGE